MSQVANRQKLLKRLKTFCGMLGDDLQSLDAQLLARIDDVIRRLSTPTKVAIAGMTGGDHRHLAEFFLGTDIFSSLKDADASPVIQVRFGSKVLTHALYDGQQKSFDGLAIDETLAEARPNAIHLEIPNPIVSEIGFTILPKYEAEGDRTRYLVDLLNDTDVIVWCSSASMPWSPQERRLWFTVPDQLKGQSVLALTGADVKAIRDARQTVEEKRNLISDDFRSISTIAINAAKDSAPQGQVVDPVGFSTSGGQRLLKELMELVKAGQSDAVTQARQLMADLDKVPLGSAQPAPEKPVAVVTEDVTVKDVAGQPSHEDVQAFLLTRAAACTAALDTCEKNEFSPLFDEIASLLSGLSGFADDGVKLSADHELMMKQIEEAKELTGLLSYEDNEIAAREASDIVRQVSTDFWTRTETGTANDDTPILSEFEQGSAVG